MDLRVQKPRSPYAELGGFAWLPRLIDKAKAKASGRTGIYLYNSVMDREFFSFFGIDAIQFLLTVSRHQDDAPILAWLENETTRKGDADKAAWREHLFAYAPDSPEAQQYFETFRNTVAPGRTDLTTWCQVLAADEGLPIPALQ